MEKHLPMMLRGELRLTLRLPQFGDDLRPTSFRALFLGDGVVSTGQAGRCTILAQSRAVADALDLSSVTSIASSFQRSGRSCNGGL